MGAPGAAGTPPRTSTFLFTDLENHTKLWQGNPDAMAEALASHDELIREAVASAGGRVVKTEGDSAMAVFGEPVGAVNAAHAIQVALANREWPGVGQLRARVGLHTGTAYERDGRSQRLSGQRRTATHVGVRGIAAG